MSAFFPQIIERIGASNTIYETMPDIFVGSESHINLEVAIEGIAWCVNMLLVVHEKVHGEFLQRVKQQSDDFLANVYRYGQRYYLLHYMFENDIHILQNHQSQAFKF